MAHHARQARLLLQLDHFGHPSRSAQRCPHRGRQSFGLGLDRRTGRTATPRRRGRWGRRSLRWRTRCVAARLVGADTTSIRDARFDRCLAGRPVITKEIQPAERNRECLLKDTYKVAIAAAAAAANTATVARHVQLDKLSLNGLPTFKPGSSCHLASSLPSTRDHNNITSAAFTRR